MKEIVPLTQGLLEKGWIPDPVIRFGMRLLLGQKLKEERVLGTEFGYARHMKLVEELRTQPIAVDTRKANEQHYEVPTDFFRHVLGKHMKYSSCYYREGVAGLDEAEADMLAITCERAELEDGQTVLELGCGWGSLTLFMAARYPRSRFTAVSNSRTQKEHIDAQARERGLSNIEIITADMNVFTIDRRFDRVVSVEMFEHMRNYQKLLGRVASFLKDGGKLFVHIFTHREFAYLYDEQDKGDWIARYFFTGGIMPSDHLLLYFPEHFAIEKHWRVNGSHYQKTAEAWLRNMDNNREKLVPILRSVYGEKELTKWWVYWRVFFMACAELWGYKGGTEWIVSHYLFRRR